MSDINANVAVRIPSSLFVMPRSFKPIPNGNIYIGRPGTDPTQPLNQIPVYYANESGVMVQVAQPLVINNAGYPVYNGVVTDFLTEGPYAMAVYNTSGVQEFYFSNIMPSIAGGQAINLKKFLTVPETSVEALPNVNMRKNKLLGFDAYGDPIAIANQTGQYNPVEIARTTPPAPKDKQLYLLIGGYKVPAWPTRENTHMVGYPTTPRIVSPVFRFRAAVNHNYRIPFAILNAELSAALQVTADKPERFTTLKASRLTQSSGVIDMTTNYSERDDERSVITLTDTLSGTMQSFTVLHSYTPLDSLTVETETVSDGTIHMEYKPQSLPQDTHRYAAVIKAEVTVSPDISHRVAHMLNYFNEAVVVRNNAVFTPFVTEITLEAPYKGSLEVILKDSLNGLTVSTFVDVDFAGR